MSDQLAHKGTIIIVLYSKVGLFLYQHLGGHISATSMQSYCGG